jgi:hypothetical protein
MKIYLPQPFTSVLGDFQENILEIQKIYRMSSTARKNLFEYPYKITSCLPDPVKARSSGCTGEDISYLLIFY